MTGDGELQEGSNWEAIMAAGHYQLGNIVMITDKNQIEATGWTKDIMNIDPLDKKLEAFGWDVISIDGHNMEEILKTLHSLPASDSQIRRKPIAIIQIQEKRKLFRTLKTHLTVIFVPCRLNFSRSALPVWTKLNRKLKGAE